MVITSGFIKIFISKNVRTEILCYNYIILASLNNFYTVDIYYGALGAVIFFFFHKSPCDQTEAGIRK